MTNEDIEFLKELQHELNTQDNLSQASPVYWSIMEDKKVYKPGGCGDYIEFIMPDECDGTFTIEDIIDYVKDNYYDDFVQEQKEEWDEIVNEPFDRPYNIMEFLRDNDIIESICQVEYSIEQTQSRETGCFLTHRAAKEYVQKFGYNHSNPRTYAMTAYRNFELERLLDIIKTADFDKLKD